MSWGAFGSGLLGGQHAFRLAVQDQEEKARIAELDRRYQTEQAYRASQDKVEADRYADTVKRQSTLDSRAERREQTADDRQAFSVAQEYGGDIDSALAGRLRSTGMGSALRDRQVIGAAGLGAQASLSSIASAPAVAGIPGMQTAGETVTSVAKPPQQLAQEEATALSLDKGRRDRDFREELARTTDPAAQYALARKYGVADIRDPEDRAMQKRALDIQAANAAAARLDRADARADNADYRRDVLQGQARERVQRAFTAWQREVVDATQTLPTPEQEQAILTRLMASEPLLASAAPAPAAPAPKPGRFSGLFGSTPTPATNERR